MTKSKPLGSGTRARKRLLIVLFSLRAEGGPRLVLELARGWKSTEIELHVGLLKPLPLDLESEFLAQGVSIHQLAEWSESGYTRYGKLVLTTWRLCRQIVPDAVLSVPDGLHSFIAIGARAANVRCVVAHLGRYPEATGTLEMRKYRLMVQLGRLFTTRIICCSNYVMSGAIQNLRLPRNELEMVYNGCNIFHFRDASKAIGFPRRCDCLNLVMVGRLDRTKDYPTLIGAVRELVSRGVDVELNLVGGGLGFEEIMSWSFDAGVGDRVNFLGQPDDVASIVKAMDIFVFSAFSGEGLGISLIEAMAAGIPIVATDVGACREVLDHGALGLLAAPRDAGAMADAIEAVCADPFTAASRANKAQQKAFREFASEVMARRYAELLGLPMSDAA